MNRNELVKIPYYYNSVWHTLYNSIKEYGVKKGYEIMLNEYNFKTKNFPGYFEIISGYINDFNQFEATLNPDYFKFVDLENLNGKEKNTVLVLAASMDLRLNKPIFEMIYENVANEYGITGDFKLIIAKYILKYMITKNKIYILKNLISEVFTEHILYKFIDKNKWIVYVKKKKDTKYINLIDQIKKYFLENDESIKVFWNKHFIVVDHNIVSRTDNNLIF